MLITASRFGMHVLLPSFKFLSTLLPSIQRVSVSNSGIWGPVHTHIHPAVVLIDFTTRLITRYNNFVKPQVLIES
jgi:hypothetical protein